MRFAAQLLNQRARRAGELVDRLDHVHRDADGASLIGDRARDGLTNPPRRVGRELVAAAVLEFFDRLHETDVAFLDQVEELQSAVRVLLGDRDDEAKVRDDQLLFRLIGFLFAGLDVLDRDAKLGVARTVERLELAQLLLILLQAPAIEVAARLVLLALERCLVLADHRGALRQLGIDVLQLVDHAIPRLRREVDLPQLGCQVLRQTVDSLVNGGDRALAEFLLAQLRFLIFDPFVEARDFLEDRHDVVDLRERRRRQRRGIDLVLILGHREIDHLFDDARVFLGALVDLQDFFENDAVLRERLVDLALALFDALGDVDFALSVEELDRAHLAQVHADGIVGLVDDAAGGRDDVGLHFLALIDFFFFDRAVDRHRALAGGGRELLLGVFNDVDAEVGEADVDLVELLGKACDFLRENFVDLVVEEESFFLPQSDELLDLDVFFFDAQLTGPFLNIRGFLLEIRTAQACRHLFSRSSSLCSFASSQGHSGNRKRTIIISACSTYATIRPFRYRADVHESCRRCAPLPRCLVGFPVSAALCTPFASG